MSDPFARVPLWILGRSDVSWAGKILYGLLARYVGKGRTAWPSLEVLATDMRSSRRNVERWLAELRAAGLVDVERTGRANTYRLLGAPPEQAPADGTIGVPDASLLADQMRQPDRVRPAGSDGSDPSELADLIRQEQRIGDADTSSLEEIMEEKTEERPPPPSAESDLDGAEQLVERAYGLLLRGYQRRYEAAAGDVWMGHGRVQSDVRTCARWCVARGEPEIERRVEQLLAGMFDARRERFAAERWPWSWVARNPHDFAAPPAAPRSGGKAAGFVPLRARPGEFGNANDYGDDDIPTDKPQREVNYG